MYKRQAKSAFAAYLSKQQQTQEAIEYYEGALQIARQFAKTYPKELVTALRNLAFLTKRAKEAERSAELFGEAFRVVEQCQATDVCTTSLWLKTYYRVLKTDGLKLTPTRKQALKFKARELSRKLSPESKTKLTRTLSGLKGLGGI